MVAIRRARLEDREHVYRFHRALYVEHRGRVMPEGMELLYAYRDFENVLRQDVDAMLRNPSTTILLAERNDTALGYASGFVSNDQRRVLSRKGTLGDWYVLPDERGSGVGRKLVEALFAIFADQGCSVVETSTWPFNTDTRKAMAKLGFSEVQITYRQELGTDDVEFE